ncbi:MAG TPA: hypothetical protein VJT73_21180 [Polyangiaceae bacterium]|nr:hypothetical protein [Polyangiaceae bacterium]
MHSPIPSGVQQILDLFDASLPDVKFGDLDASVLASAAEEVTVLAIALAQAEAALEVTRAAFVERQEALVQKAHRALAHARVYAEGDAALSARVDGISVSRPARRVARVEASEAPDGLAAEVPRRRGRPRKVDTGELLDLSMAEAAAS